MIIIFYKNFRIKYSADSPSVGEREKCDGEALEGMLWQIADEWTDVDMFQK